jgi:uncharacterized protein YecT (DUF1311 family)
MRNIRWALALLFLSAAPAVAQDCGSDNLTQQEMNDCAAETLAYADEELNAVWDSAISYAEGAGVDDMLRDAQRLWIGYRDAACAAEAALYEGGSIAPLIYAECLTRLTVARTDDLLFFAAE